MFKKFITLCLSLIILSACTNDNEHFKNCKQLVHLIAYGEEDTIMLQLHDILYACGGMCTFV